MTKKQKISIILGYSLFGLTIGCITGLTDSEISNFFLSLLVTFVGGSIGYYLFKDTNKIEIFGYILAFFSICCLLGVLSGAYLKINKLLINEKQLSKYPEISEKPILKNLNSNDITELRSILRIVEEKELNNDNILYELEKMNIILNKYE